MRPEYIEAVDAVRWGWSFWATFGLPLLIIWSTVLFRPVPPLPKRHIIIASGFSAGCILFWVLTLTHLELVQHAKSVHMQTNEERRDFSGDNPFAPLAAIPVSGIYCFINLVAASFVFWGIRFVCFVRAKLSSNKKEGADFSTSQRDENNPYKPPLY